MHSEACHYNINNLFKEKTTTCKPGLTCEGLCWASKGAAGEPALT